MSTIPGLQVRLFLGLNNTIKGNATYVTDHDILYPAGGLLIIHNYTQKQQKYIKLSDSQKVISMIVVSPNKKIVALAEKGEKPSITLYDLTTLKKKKVLGLPYESAVHEFASVTFTFDSKYVVAVTGDPDWMMLYYNWEKGKVETSTKANSPPANTGPIVQVATNPTDNTVVSLVGPGIFRLLSVSDMVWRQYGFQKAENFPLTCVCWLTSDRVIAGTKDGRLIIVEYGDLRALYKAQEVTLIDIKVKDDSAPAGQVVSGMNLLQESDESDEFEVGCLTSFSKGFAYTCTSGVVILFEKDSNFRYKKRNVFCINAGDIKDKSRTEMNKIQNISVSPTQDKLLCTTHRMQIFAVRLWGQDISQAPEIEFKEVGEALHHGPVVGIALCAWKQILITCGQLDRTVRVWDYVDEKILLTKKYQEDIYCVTLHPSGLYTVMGFSDKLRFMILLIDDLQVVREFPIRYCETVQFSNNGHFFAAMNGNVINIYSTITFQLVHILKGHSGQVSTLFWLPSDFTLFSCGLDGAIYEWDLRRQKRATDIFIKECQHRGLVATQDGNSAYTVGSDGMLKEVMEGQVAKEVDVGQNQLNCIALSRSEMLMFIGGDDGSIISIKFPLVHPPIYLQFSVHNHRIVTMKLTYDDQVLISCSEDGTMCFWKITSAEGKQIELDPHFKYSNEILISKDDLREKIKNIKNLSTRIKELDFEHSYQIRQMETLHKEEVEELHSGYCSAIEELKEKNQELETEHTIELNKINRKIGETKHEHEQAMEKLESDYNAKLIVEYTKFQDLEERFAAWRQENERKFQELAESKKVALEEMTLSYELKLEEKSMLIEEMIETSKQTMREHEEIKDQIEDDADREIVELRTRYEDFLQEEREVNIRLRGETGVMKKKFISAQKDIEELKHQVLTLHGEQTSLKKIIQDLEKDISDLKKEIAERDNTIHDKERRIYDLKRKNHELEKYKYVLNYKINELRMQVEPKDNEIKEKREQIDDMELEMERMLHLITNLELQSTELREKLHGTEKELHHAKILNRDSNALLKRIRTDIHITSGLIQNPNKLKEAVVKLYHQYNQEKDFEKGRVHEQEAETEFMRQREYLENTVAGLKQLAYREQAKKKIPPNIKLIQDNTHLIEEINKLRYKLKTSQHHANDLECLLGLSSTTISPIEARKKIEDALQAHEDIHKYYRDVILEYEKKIKLLKEEIDRLKSLFDVPVEDDSPAVEEETKTTNDSNK
ncbi:testes of unusual size [Lycorma delicatula]|uniref:testes of unusual size n=1 Tax=Lycorma delicatula TaxID=130591 RepID=UPI003F515272